MDDGTVNFHVLSSFGLDKETIVGVDEVLLARELGFSWHAA